MKFSAWRDSAANSQVQGVWYSCGGLPLRGSSTRRACQGRTRDVRTVRKRDVVREMLDSDSR